MEPIDAHYVDANVIIRYVAFDDPILSEAARAFFQRVADADVVATTSEAVFAEVVYVLSSPVLYKQSRSHIRNVLKAVFGLRGWRQIDRETWSRALDVYVEHRRLSLVDALAVAHVERRGLTAVASFDKDFDRIPSIERIRPGP